MRLHTLLATLAVAGFVTACGGDGGDGGTTTPTSSSVVLSGVAAKGALQFALVSVHPVKADGTVDLTKTLSSAESDANGNYTLPGFEGVRGTPYIVRVSAIAGKTKTLDEVTGTTVSLPEGFSLRSLVIAPTTGTTTITSHVTPFTELAAAAATSAPGGITAANATTALSNVRQLLGFDSSVVAPATLQDAKTPEQQALAVMLTAVSKLANDGGLGCSATDLGARTKCVVDALAASASITSTNPGTVGGVNVAEKLVAAAEAVATDPQLTAGTTIGEGTVAGVIGKLEGDGKPAPAGNVTAIAAATQLFTGIRSDFQALFSKGGATSIAKGAVNQEAFKFVEAMEAVQAPAEMVVKDAGAIITGIDMYNDFMFGTGAMERQRGDENNGFPTVGCSLYTTAQNTVLASSKDDAKFIGCTVNYKVVFTFVNNVTVMTRYRHGFSIEPKSDGTFAYSTRARRTTSCNPAPCANPVNEALSESVIGVATPTIVNNRITAVKLAGDFAAAFETGGTTLVDAKTTVDLSGTRTIGTDNMSSTLFKGTAKSYKADGTLLGTLDVKSGSTSEIPVSWDAKGNLVARGSSTAVADAGGDIATASIDLVWTTGNSEFAGTLSLTDNAWDKSQTSHIPTKGTLSGSLRNISNGTTNEFLAGSLTAAITGYGNYTATANDSATNNFNTSLSFTGSVTAPTRPKLELTLSSAMASHEDGPATVTLSYRSIVNGAPKQQVGAVATRQANGKYSTKLTEAASNLSMTWGPDAKEADLYINNTEVVGKFKDLTLTFTDGTFISLDIGL